MKAIYDPGNDIRHILLHNSPLIFFSSLGALESRENDTGSLTTLFAPNEQQVVKVENISIDTAAQSRRDDATTGFKDAKVLLRNLRVDFNVQLNASRSPWDVAAGWVSAREVVPEDAPELEHCFRVLGLRRVPVTVGRRVRVKQELALVASQQLLKTFYQKDDNSCFYGRCQNCVEDTGVCAMGDVLEGAIILWLPDTVQLDAITHPWYSHFKEKNLAKYPSNGSYCGIVRQLSPFKEKGYLLLDIVDTAIFDFLIGNADRHHCEIISNMERGMVVMLDNGKRLRHSTWQRIRSLRHNVLSYILGEVLKSDPVQPVLSRDHLLALDRRLAKVWVEIEKCIAIHGVEAVLVQNE
ncbi:hypothetical protein C0Q70_18025 [Pomacea canaliculata]|uniref:FAM20 C-terminal domain-containing protein n=1 Tax=Pomacea canaliculata TaxID=400727 RepID=A0A2T7NM25_POMCA|nr:hypothetical protein C0Q70_18025 [Pomacea canaliculata]